MYPKEKMSEITVILGIATGVLSVLTFMGGSYAYIKASSRKEYASERDIGHLKNDLKQLTRNIEELWRQNDRRFDFFDLKLTEMSIKMGIAQTVKNTSPDEFGKKDRD